MYFTKQIDNNIYIYKPILPQKRPYNQSSKTKHTIATHTHMHSIAFTYSQTLPKLTGKPKKKRVEVRHSHTHVIKAKHYIHLPTSGWKELHRALIHFRNLQTKMTQPRASIMKPFFKYKISLQSVDWLELIDLRLTSTGFSLLFIPISPKLVFDSQFSELKSNTTLWHCQKIERNSGCPDWCGDGGGIGGRAPPS